MKTTANYSTQNKQVVFIVDDQPLFANILKEELENNSTAVYLFTSGEECIANLDKKPNIIVLDYELDDGSNKQMNGIDVLKKIKSIDAEIEIVMLSGHEEVNIATTSIKSGAYDYVVKNESTFVNVKNKMANIFKKLELIKEIKEVKKLKTGIAAVTLIGIIIASISQEFSNF